MLKNTTPKHKRVDELRQESTRLRFPPGMKQKQACPFSILDSMVVQCQILLLVTNNQTIFPLQSAFCRRPSARSLHLAEDRQFCTQMGTRCVVPALNLARLLTRILKLANQKGNYIG